MKKLIIATLVFSLLFLTSCLSKEETETTRKSTTASETAVEKTTAEKTTEEITENVTTKVKEETTAEATTEEASSETTAAEEKTTLPKVTKAEKSLNSLRSKIAKKKAKIAVAYVGYYEGNFKSVKAKLKKEGITEKYPFIKDISKKDFISLEGNEVYVVVPAEETEVCVYEYAFNGYGEGSAVRELYIYNDASPFIIRGNISDIMPNFQLDVRVKSELKLSYNPCLSLENGKLQKKKGVYDFSPYDKLPFFEEVTEEERNEPFCGIWYGEAEYGNGGIAYMTLTLNSDTTASYKYGDPFSDCIESFEGTWNEITGILALNLEGGPTDTEGLSRNEAVYSLTPVLSWRMEDGNLILTHEQGDVILYNTKGAQFTFSRVE